MLLNYLYKNPIELVCKSVIILLTIYNCRYLWYSVSCSDVLYIVLYRKNKYLFYFTVRVINIGMLLENNVLYFKGGKKCWNVSVRQYYTSILQDLTQTIIWASVGGILTTVGGTLSAVGRTPGYLGTWWWSGTNRCM